MTKLTSRTPVIDAWNLDKFPKSGFEPKTHKWLAIDTEEAFLKNRNDKEQLYGSNDIEYKLNSFGYRCDEFDFNSKGDSIVYIGCSLGIGLALLLEQCWTYILHQKICSFKNTKYKYYNLSMPGRSNDYIARMSYYSKRLCPVLTVVAFTFPSRREYSIGGNIHNYIPNCKSKEETKHKKYKYQTLMLDDYEDQLNFDKNFILVSSLLSDVNWCFTTPGMFYSEMFHSRINNCYNKVNSSENNFLHHGPDRARDLIHPGPIANKNGAKEVFQNILKSRILT